MARKDQKILDEIRDNYARYKEAWKDIYNEGAKDMTFVAGDPWDPKDKQARKDLDRPCMSFDELGQYINQLINDVRANKRAIAIAPAGNGAGIKLPSGSRN